MQEYLCSIVNIIKTPQNSKVDKWTTCIRNEHLTETKIRRVTIMLVFDKFFCITRMFWRNSRMWYIFQFFPTLSFNLFDFFLYVQRINE